MNLDKEKIKSELLRNKEVISSGCWYWSGPSLPSGYGKLYINRDVYLAHRLSAYIYLDFDLESDLFVLHKCDFPRCINPEHLFIGTAQDNQDDFFGKGYKRNAANQYTGKVIDKCNRGHERNEENTRIFVDKGKTRYECRVCKNEAQKVRRMRW